MCAQLSDLMEEWRILQWGHKENDLQFVKDYQPQNTEVKQLRVLLHGPAGAGKSSFINSVDSVLRGRITCRALTENIGGDIFTPKHKTYKFHNGGPGTFYSFVFSDTMGIDQGTDRGVRVEDIKLAMKGHIKDGYNFNPRSVISEGSENYNKNPTLEDKVHVLVCVVGANTVRFLDHGLLRKMREVRLAASDMGIPQLAILTNIDKACPEVNTNVRNVYKSKYLKEQMDDLSVTLGLSPNCIFPVRNYHSEIDTNDEVDTVILSALKQILESGEDFLKHL